jgi:hypothetical protein
VDLAQAGLARPMHLDRVGPIQAVREDRGATGLGRRGPQAIVRRTAGPAPEDLAATAPGLVDRGAMALAPAVRDRARDSAGLGLVARDRVRDSAGRARVGRGPVRDSAGRDGLELGRAQRPRRRRLSRCGVRRRVRGLGASSGRRSGPAWGRSRR